MRSWRPLGLLLLVVTLLWFALGPLRTSGIGSSTSRPAWGSASPPATLPGSSAGASRGATDPQADPQTDPQTDPDTGGLFGVVDEARRRYQQARSQDWRGMSAWPTPTRRDQGSGAEPDSPRATPAPTAGGSPAGAAAGGSGLPADAEKIMLVLDASGSMARRDQAGRTSMEAAQEATADALETVPTSTLVGLRVFGSRVDGHGRPTSAACRDTRVVQPLAPLDRRRMTTAVFSFDPLGETPIARSIDAAVDDLGRSGRRAILLVTDGEESCAPDPCRAVADARAAGVDVRVDIVGLRVGNRARDQLQCIARSTNGRYSEAADDSQLSGTLRAALVRLRADTSSAASGSAAREGSQGWAAASRAEAQVARAQAADGSGSGRGAATALAFVLLLAFFAAATRRR